MQNRLEQGIYLLLAVQVLTVKMTKRYNLNDRKLITVLFQCIPFILFNLFYRSFLLEKFCIQANHLDLLWPIHRVRQLKRLNWFE